MNGRSAVVPARVQTGLAAFDACKSFLRAVTDGLRNDRGEDERAVSNQVERALHDSRAIFNHEQRKARTKGARMRDRRAA